MITSKRSREAKTDGKKVVEDQDGRVGNERRSGGHVDCSSERRVCCCEQRNCIKASKELFSLLARYTNSEVSTIVRSVPGLVGLEACKIQQKNTENNFQVQRECTHPMPTKDVSQVMLTIIQWENTRRRREDSTLVEVFRSVGNMSAEREGADDLDGIGENCEDLKAKVVSYTTNKTEQARGGQKEMHMPIEVHHGGGSEPEEEYW